jgi:cation:H+ antiporter
MDCSELIICAGFIIWAGSLLSKYSDVIAEKTGMSRSFVGNLFLAASAPLPETMGMLYCPG